MYIRIPYKKDIPHREQIGNQNRNINDKISTTEMNESVEYSLNDTPGKDISNQINEYNERMNRSFPDYDDTPRQGEQDLSIQIHDSDDSKEVFNQQDLLSIQNRLFHQAASGVEPSNQQGGESGGIKIETRIIHIKTIIMKIRIEIGLTTLEITIKEIQMDEREVKED